MVQKRTIETDDDLLAEYDFTGAVRGKYFERYRQGTNVVLLDPDVAGAFADSEAVNDALRILISIARAKVNAGSAQPVPTKKANKPLQRASQKARNR